ncbi:MAG: hypothetical protein ABI144_02700, partial [Gallionella sp.]
RGKAGTVASMRADTGDYLAALQTEVAQAKKAGGTVTEQAARLNKSAKLNAFKRMQDYAALEPQNVLNALQDADRAR